MKDTTPDHDEIQDTDIVFDCPRCGKSLAIDNRGAGLQVRCTDCGNLVPVPIPEGILAGEEEESDNIQFQQSADAAPASSAINCVNTCASCRAYLSALPADKTNKKTQYITLPLWDRVGLRGAGSDRSDTERFCSHCGKKCEADPPIEHSAPATARRDIPPPVPISFHCKACSVPLEVKASLAGALIDCPKCQQTVQVPECNPTVDSVGDATAIAEGAGVPSAGQYVCLHCKRIVTLLAKPKRSFMGFLCILCPRCNKEFRYPLTPGHAVFYWLLIGGNIVYLAYLLSHAHGREIQPKPLGIIVFVSAVVSLFKSHALSRRIAVLRRSLP